MLGKSIPVTNVTKVGKNIEGRVIPPGATVIAPFDWLTKFGFDDGLRFDFSPYGDMLAVEQDGKPVVDWWCPLSAVDGYGRHALDIYRGMRRLGWDVRLRNSGTGVDQTFLDPDIVAEKYRSMYLMPARVAIAMSVPYDPQLSGHQSLTKIAITQFETSRIPERHVEAVNRCDHLITTSSFQVPIWKRGGLRIPISVLTPGVDTDFFRHVQRPIDGTFKVLMLGALTERKNPLMAIRVFQLASRHNPDWRLTIKSRKAQGLSDVMAALAIPEPRGQWNRCLLTSPTDPRITLIVGDSTQEQIAHLYFTHDAFLWPSKGEGVGLPPIEAMSTGMELICSDNSGMSDYLDDRWSWPIKCPTTEYAGTDTGFGRRYVATFGDVGDWWVPDEKHAVKQMERCFADWWENRDRNRPTKGDRAARMVRERHTIEHQAQSVMKIVEKYL